MAAKTTTEKIAPVAAEATESKLLKQFKACRRVSTPIVGIETHDPEATMIALNGVIVSTAPIFKWDIVNGVAPVNKVAEALGSMNGLVGNDTINPVEALNKAQALPTGAVLYMLNAQRQLSEIAVVQAVWNLRQIFKLNRRTLVMVSPTITLPAEIASDVVILTEPLPTRDALAALVDQQHKNASLPLPSDAQRAKALDAVVGLPSFAAEQVIAMSLTREGLDHDSLWDRKCKAIEQTKGLSVYRGTETFDDLRGVDNVVAFMKLLVEADAFRAVVFIDEGEKALAGGMSDHVGDGGVAKDQVGQILTYIQDTGSLGVLLGGIAGTGKSAIAKATGNAAGKPTITLDMNGMKSSSLGDSEGAIRNALKVITATAEGKVLFIMTANNTVSFSPEINRRFPDQFFFDNPDDAGVDALFTLYGKKFNLSAAQLKREPGFARGWTGAEVKRACERAAMFKSSVTLASQFIVPQVVSAEPVIARLREQARGRFLSANYSGIYTGPRVAGATSTAPSRAIDLDE